MSTDIITLTMARPVECVTGLEPVTLTQDSALSPAGQPADPAPQVRRESVVGPICEYGVDVNPGGPYSKVRFASGSIEAPENISYVKLLGHHDDVNPLGVATSLSTVDQVVYGRFQMGRHPAAVEAVGLVEDGILDGFSVGVIPIESHDENGTRVITRAKLREVSLVSIPAVSTARATVAASERKDSTMTDTIPAPVEAASERSVADQVRDALAAMAPAPLPEAAVAASARPTPQAASIVATERPGRYPGVRGNDGRMYTAGDYLASFAAAVREGKWDAYRTITAALADEISSDVPGLMPQQIVGNLLGQLSDRRPVWDSFTSQPMPMIGEKFSRPRITQHVKVDEQATQKTEIASQKFTCELDEVAKKTFAGGLDIAQQAIDWTSPALLNQLVLDFTRVYARRTEKYASEFLVAAAAKGGKVTWDGTAMAFPAALASAAGSVYSSLGDDADAMPNTVWVASDIWIRMASLTDKNDRPLFPALGPSNALGMMTTARPDSGPSGTGFRWVVGKRLAPGTFIVGDSEYVESYENGRRFLQALAPSLLGLDLAVMGYAAAYNPFPKALAAITVTPPAGEKKA